MLSFRRMRRPLHASSKFLVWLLPLPVTFTFLRVKASLYRIFTPSLCPSRAPHHPTVPSVRTSPTSLGGTRERVALYGFRCVCRASQLSMSRADAPASAGSAPEPCARPRKPACSHEHDGIDTKGIRVQPQSPRAAPAPGHRSRGRARERTTRALRFVDAPRTRLLPPPPQPRHRSLGATRPCHKRTADASHGSRQVRFVGVAVCVQHAALRSLAQQQCSRCISPS